MATNYGFTHREDAERFQEREGGQLYDNTHNQNEWSDEQYTVHVNEENARDSYQEFLDSRNG